MKSKSITQKITRLSLGGLAVIFGSMILASFMTIMTSFLIGLLPVVITAAVIGLIYYTIKH